MIRCGVSDDSSALKALGYRQELRRGMSAFGSFAISFSVISILTGGISLYGYGLGLGGPLEMTLGWPLVAIMTTFVALSLAELSSAYPTAGAIYHWSAILGGPRLGFYSAWLNLIGQVGVVAGVDYAFAEFLAPVVGAPAGRTSVLAIYAVVLVVHGAINHVGIGVLSACNAISAAWHLLGTAIVVGLLLFFAPLQPVSFLVSTHVRPTDSGVTYPLAYACLVGLLQAQWTFTGYDASAHSAEETIDAAYAAPRGIMSSVISSAVVGWILLLGVTLAIRDLPAAAAAPNAFSFIVEHALSARLARAVLGIVLGAMWFCGLASITSNSRMLFALARDGGVPAAPTVARVGRHQTPYVAIWLCVVVAFLLAVWGRAYSVIVSISVIGLYGSYALPIVASEVRWRGGWRPHGPFRLRASRAVARVALTWIAIITVLFVLPPNERTGWTFAGLMFLLVALDLGWAKRRFKGPMLPAELQSGNGAAMSSDGKEPA
jgi:amino acid transporter